MLSPFRTIRYATQTLAVTLALVTVISTWTRRQAAYLFRSHSDCNSEIPHNWLTKDFLSVNRLFVIHQSICHVRLSTGVVKYYKVGHAGLEISICVVVPPNTMPRL